MSGYPPVQPQPISKEEAYEEMHEYLEAAEVKSKKEGLSGYDLEGEIADLGQLKSFADARLSQILKPAAPQDQDRGVREQS